MDKAIDRAWRELLAAAMHEGRMTQGDVAEKTGGEIARYKVGRILAGKYRTKLADAILISDAVGINLAEFVSTSTAIVKTEA